ncbi:MAG TPA: hypothetical protein VGO61_07815 [Steroidobacteraceae bacterium]|jgi:hypothetical protein|nr:hypothetical protein [Steroidobacteraceae bacterium]
MPGIFISKGMTVSIPPGGLKVAFGEDGAPRSNITLHVRFDVCPTWVALAIKHLERAKEARVERENAWKGEDEGQKAATLESEFEASMQAIMAAAIAIDAFYAIVKPHVKLPADLVDRWRTGRTPRYAQIGEVLKRAFSLKPKGAAGLRANLKEMFRIRDLAVHPSGKIDAPLFHPELDVGVEWRFAYFRASNAELIVNAATQILWELSNRGKPSNSALQEYSKGLAQRLTIHFPDGHPLFQETHKE